MAPKSKEAIILTVNCGKSMSKKCFDSDKSVFQLSKQCLENIIRQKIFAETKNEYLLIEFSTSTAVGLKINGQLRPPNFELLKYITTRLEVSDTKQSQRTNVIEALNGSIDQVLAKVTAKRFTAVKVVLFTDFDHFNQLDFVRFSSQVIPKLRANSIQLIIISDFDPNSCSSRQLSNSQREAVKLMELTEQSSLGFCYDLNTALKAFTDFEGRTISSTSWYSNLQLGRGLNALQIPICALIKGTPYQRKKFSSFVRTDNNSSNISNINDSKEDMSPSLTTFESQTSESLVKIEKEDIIRGYRYGQTIVPFSEEDKKIFDYNTNQKGIKIIGFTSIQNIDISQRFGTKTSYVFPDPRPKQNNHRMVFQALVIAMIEQLKVAIVRYNYNDRSAPQMGYLFPFMENTNLLLSYIQLPFAEDVRNHRFPSLQSEPNYYPTDKQLEAIDSLIDSMDLMTADIDVDGNPCEALKSHEVRDPLLQHWFSCLYYRQLNKIESELPQISDHHKSQIEAPKQLSQNSVKPLIQILENFTLETPKDKSPKKKIPSKQSSSQLTTDSKSLNKRQRIG